MNILYLLNIFYFYINHSNHTNNYFADKPYVPKISNIVLCNVTCVFLFFSNPTAKYVSIMNMDTKGNHNFEKQVLLMVILIALKTMNCLQQREKSKHHISNDPTQLVNYINLSYSNLFKTR